MDSPGKIHSKQTYHQNHTFVRLGKLPVENVFFALLRMESLQSTVRRSVCVTFLARWFWPFCHRILFPDYDLNLRGTFRAPTFALSFVAV